MQQLQDSFGFFFFQSFPDNYSSYVRYVSVWAAFHFQEWIFPQLCHHASFFFVVVCFVSKEPRGGVFHAIQATGINTVWKFNFIFVSQIIIFKHINCVDAFGWGVGQGPGHHRGPKMLPGRVESWGRELPLHWLRNTTGGVFWLWYLMLCSIVAEWVFQLVWHRRVGGLLFDRIPWHFFFNNRIFFLFVCFVLKMSFSCDHSLDGSFPPSPAEDTRGSQRLSWGSLLQRLTELKGINHRVTTDHQCSRSETGECCRLLSQDALCLLFRLNHTDSDQGAFFFLHL